MHGHSLPWFTHRLPEATQLSNAKGILVGQINDGRQADRIIKETPGAGNGYVNQHEAPWNGRLLMSCTELRDATGALVGQFVDGRVADEVLDMVNNRGEDQSALEKAEETVKMARQIAEGVAAKINDLPDMEKQLLDDLQELILTLS